MGIFEFIEDEDFDSNLQAFLKQMSEEDSEMTAIFEKHLPLLRNVANESQRRAAITAFNEQVKVELEAMEEEEEASQ